MYLISKFINVTSNNMNLYGSMIAHTILTLLYVTQAKFISNVKLVTSRKSIGHTETNSL